MTILNTLRVSGSDDYILSCIEIKSEEKEESKYICSGYEDTILKDENNKTFLATATGFEASLPAKTNQGTQNLQFIFVNQSKEVFDYLEARARSPHKTKVILREYLSSDFTIPADTPIEMDLSGFSWQGDLFKIQCSFFKLIDTAFPRDVYKLKDFPGLKYVK